MERMIERPRQDIRTPCTNREQIFSWGLYQGWGYEMNAWQYDEIEQASSQSQIFASNTNVMRANTGKYDTACFPLMGV